MPSRHDPVDCLSDILENIERIKRHIGHLGFDTFIEDDLRRDAVERCMGRICEAAVRLHERAHELMPQQPWREIRGMGNQLRHAYDRVESQVIWNVVVRYLPDLERDVRLALTALGNL